MTDQNKACIVGIGVAISLGLLNIMVRVLYPPAGIISGPGFLVYALLAPTIESGCAVWAIGAVSQFPLVYFIALTVFTSPPFKWLRLFLLVVIWLALGYGGLLITGAAN